METKTRNSVTEFEGLPLVENFGSFNVYGDHTGGVIVEWRTEKLLSGYEGPLGLECAKYKAELMHLRNDVLNH